MNTESTRRGFRARGLGWPLFLGVLIALVMSIDVAMLIIAAQHPTSAVEADYYQRAADWDRRDPDEARFRQLGWIIEVAARRDASAPLEVVLSDAAGQPIADARIAVAVFHRSRPRDVLQATLAPVEVGRYRTTLGIPNAGMHELRFVIEHRDVRCVVRRVEHFVESKP
ncbi:MAG: FixH family protein [Planctomycetota bacterium]